MSDDAEPSKGHDDNESDQVANRGERAKGDTGTRWANDRLSSFAAIQRHIARIDFEAIDAARRAFEHPGALKRALDAQALAVQNLNRSINFSGLAATFKSIADAGTAIDATAARQRWAESLIQSIDFSALDAAVQSSTALDNWVRVRSPLVEWLEDQREAFSRIPESVIFNLPSIGFSGLAKSLSRWLPSNLASVDDLDLVASIAREEGIPLSWVPRTEIVISLVEADGPDARVQILSDRRADILADCELVLAPLEHEWAVQCRAAVAALRAGFGGPAQSHASNIIDSIVLGLHGRHGRRHTTSQAQANLDDLPLELAAENLTLRPLARAFVHWYSDTAAAPPEHFARHTTSHAVGHAGVFAPIPTLIAVMLATSLTVQYANRSPGPGSPLSPVT